MTIARRGAFSPLADHAPAIPAYVDSGQRYRYVNRGYEKLFRMPSAQIIGMTIGKLLGRARYEAIRPHIRRVLAGEAVTFQYDLRLRDGLHQIEMHYIPDVADGGAVRLPSGHGRALRLEMAATELDRASIEGDLR